MPLVFVESDIYAVEIESQSYPDTDATQTENPPNADIEERQEESAVLTQHNLFLANNYTLHFANHVDKTLIGVHPDLVIPPNI